MPYPFTSKEVYNQSMRMPIGPEFNPATTIGLLNRPAVSFSEQFLGKLSPFIVRVYYHHAVIKNTIWTVLLLEGVVKPLIG